MITLSSEQTAKIEILDRLLSGLDANELARIANSELVVARLKGIDDNSRILINLIKEHATLCNDVEILKNDSTQIKSDFQSLLRILTTEIFSPRYNQEFQNIKNRYSIY